MAAEPSFWDELNIQMLPGEELLLTGEPDREAIFKLNMFAALQAILFSFFLLLPFLPVWYFIAKRRATLHQHYLTNRRVIIVNGLIGYTIQSIPLNRISDVTVECTWLERYLDLRRIQIKDVASQRVDFLGIRRPLPIQERLLEEVKRLENELERGAQSATPGPNEMIELLREISDAVNQSS